VKRGEPQDRQRDATGPRPLGVSGHPRASARDPARPRRRKPSRWCETTRTERDRRGWHLAAEAGRPRQRVRSAGVDAGRQVDGGAEGRPRARLAHASGGRTNPTGGDRRRSGPNRGAEREPRPGGSSASLFGARRGGGGGTDLEGQPETAEAEEEAGKANDPRPRDRGGGHGVGNDGVHLANPADQVNPTSAAAHHAGPTGHARAGPVGSATLRRDVTSGRPTTTPPGSQDLGGI
jgi:hypothetical protein